MAGRLSAIFELIDKASGPGAKVRAALKGIDEAGKAVKADAFLDRIKGAAGGAVSALKTVGSAAVSVAAGLGALALAATVLGVKMAITASETKKQALASLDIIEGSKDAATSTLDSMKSIANATGQNDGAILDMYKALRLAGQGADDAKQSILAALDVKAVGSEESASALQEILKKTAATGEFKIEGRQMKSLGIPEDALVEALKSVDKYKDQSNAALKAAIESGSVTATDGTKALLKAVSDVYDKGGPLGGAAKDILGNSVGGQFQVIKNLIGDMFENVDLSPIIAAFKTLGDVLKGPAGAAAVKAIGDGFGYLTTKLAEIATPENIEMLVNALVTLGEWSGKVIDWVIQMAGVIRDELSTPEAQKSIDKLWGALKHLYDDLSKIPWADIITGLVDAILVAGEVIAAITNGALDAVEWVVGAFTSMDASLHATMDGIRDWLTGAWDDIVAFFTGLPDTLEQAGIDIVDGLWSGIKSTWAAMIEDVEGLVDLLPDAVKRALGIASPSKVFMKLGEQTIEGFNVGIAQGANDNAVTDAAFPDGTSAAVSTSVSNVGGANSVVNVTVNVEVYMNGSQADASSVKAAAQEGARKGVADGLEQASREAGATGAAA
jgi:hypothetical protein